MRVQARHRSVTAGPLLGILLLSVPAAARAADVYSTNQRNGRVLRLDFGAGTSTQVSTDGQKDLQGIVARVDAAATHLIACESRLNAVLFYENAQGPGLPIASGIALPDGPSLDAAGNLYLVASGSRASPPRVWKLPRTGCLACVGGYGPKVAVDLTPPSQGLEDTRVAPFTEGSLAAGDLLVLSGAPARVLRYPGAAAAGREVFIPTSAFPPGVRPTGLDFTPDHELLISTFNGSILRYDASGKRLSPDFATGLGSGRLKIAAGVQGGSSRAFVASRSGGTVLRFRVREDGTGAPEGGVTAGVQSPNGVALAGNSSVTPVGTNVVVEPAPEVTLTFERVTSAGFTTAHVVEFTDNRTGCYDQSLRDFFDPESALHGTLPDVNVPCYIQGFPKGDGHGNPTGPSTFLLAIIDTTAGFVGPVDFHGREEGRFGYQPACPNENLAQEPHTFYAPELQKGEALIEEEFDFRDCPFNPLDTHEGSVCPVFTDISSQCGSNRGDAWNFSLYLTARDTRPLPDVVHGKLDLMAATLERLSTLIGDHLLEAFLARQISAAREAYDGFLDTGNLELQQASSQALADFTGALYAHMDLLDHSTRNISGELIGRARSARFFMCKGSPDFGGCLALPPSHLP